MSTAALVLDGTNGGAMVRALLDRVVTLEASVVEARDHARAMEASKEKAWHEAGAMNATLIEMRGQLEDARAAAKPTIPSELRSALTQMLVRVRGRGDAGHLLHDVNRIEAILARLP